VDYVVNEAGQLIGLRVVRTRLGTPDTGGRRRPQPLPGTDHVLPASLVIEAIGQQIADELRTALPGVRLTEAGRVWVREQGFATTRRGVFAAGDLVNGGTTVVRAVAEGMQAAQAIHEFLNLR
jgi:glutamate synthase (NADPH) small chain